MGPGPAIIKPLLAAMIALAWTSAPGLAQEGFPPPPPGQGFPPATAEAPPPPAAVTRRTDAEREADLLRQLAEAGNPHAAMLIESELKGLWSRSGSAAVDLLWRRGRDALQAGAPDQAIEHFTAAIDWAPGFAEAYVARAGAYYLTNRAGPAIDDLRQALVLNPAHWEALGGFAVLLEEMGREADALEVWAQVHEMHPQNPEAKASVDRLRLLLEGRTL